MPGILGALASIITASMADKATLYGDNAGKVFGEVGEKLFGMPAPDFKHLLDTDFHAFEKKRDDIRWREYNTTSWSDLYC